MTHKTEIDAAKMKKFFAKGYPPVRRAALAFRKLGQTAAEIRKMRLIMLKRDYGYLRFMMTDYYRWLMFK